MEINVDVYMDLEVNVDVSLSAEVESVESEERPEVGEESVEIPEEKENHPLRNRTHSDNGQFTRCATHILFNLHCSNFLSYIYRFHMFLQQLDTTFGLLEIILEYS